MTGRILAVLGVVTAAIAVVLSYNMAITKAEKLTQEKAALETVLEQTRQQVANVADHYQTELEAHDDAIRARDSRVAAEVARRKEADARYRQLSEAAREWAAAAVPGDVVASLCHHPGSCVGVPAAANPATQPAEGGSGTAAATGGRLTNEALREGIEEVRGALGRCNAQLRGLQAWTSAQP